MTSTALTEEILDSAYNYEEYKTLIADLLADHKTTNGETSEDMLNYTKMNMQRSSRWDKRAKIDEELETAIRNISTNQIWMVIAEGWCGDAAQILPFVSKMTELNDGVELKLILRDEHPEVMDEFLTEGSRSIPKVVILDRKSLEILGIWGPRPKAAHADYMQKKIDVNYGNEKAAEDLHLWYARDKGKTTQEEFIELLEKIN